jgi:6-pyruvoyltetrahydropterin/6-carboxytetrahydropterin synthase
MFEIEKSFSFEAGHFLAHHEGACRNPHGHSYQVTVCLRAETLVPSGPETNMVTDYERLSEAVKPLLREFLDHTWLNDTLKTDSPTAEFIAKWVYDKLKPKLPKLSSVTVSETAKTRATYRP